MKKRSFFLQLASIVFILVSCSKSTNDDPQSPSPQQLIIGTWKQTGQNYSPAFDYNADGIPETDAFPLLRPCEKDNLLTFKSGGIWENDEGATKCSAANPQTRTGTWSLAADGVTLTTNGDVGRIVQLDNAIFKFALSFLDNGVTYTVTLSFARQ